MPETRLSSERLYEGRVVHLDVDRVRLPDGTEGTREVIRHPGAVVIVPLHDDGRVVLIRQFRYAAGEELLELPAGTLEPGEDPLVCAQRELAEETGLAARDWRPLASFFSAPGFCTELLHCYVAQGLEPSGPRHTDADEFIEPTVMPLSAAQSLARRGQMRDAKSIACLLMIHAEHRPPGPA